MKRFVIAVVVALVLGGASYFVYPYLLTLAPSRAAREPAVSTAQIEATTTDYIVDAQYPQFGIPNIDAQIKIYVENAVDAFESNAPNPPDPAALQNSFTGRFDKVYIGPDVISAELVLSQYTGGAHPLTAFSGINYDRTTGKLLTVGDALKMIGLTVEQVSVRATSKFSAQFGDAFFSDGASSDPQNYTSFTISKDAVTFIFQQYQVAPYSAGPQEILFPRK